ncbi:E3 ubiquitin-protein ligase RNFT1-like isoform X1 [Hydractinia symbiolongicarpus]|uniref:E3 ubiquitin-protein ligase RNFT1-like isoform X1 n=1 Tax=Hydractinia symbiolongicarpus TaxID=13093 RepID=UPI002550E1AC|nr:E3 ubiquitin-protein ligase RNFT1-like isoform X1 [Hydractinia symbiolongicarpus]
MAHRFQRSESESGANKIDNNRLQEFRESSFSASSQIHPISHSRSASWSNTAWLGSNSSSQDSMAAIFSPIRVIQGIVPTLTDTVSGSSTTANPQRVPGSPVNGNRTLQSLSSPAVDTNRINNSNNHVRSRSDVSSRHSRQSSAVEIDMNDIEQVASTTTPDNSGTRTQDQMEFFGTISWMEKALPFILLLLSRIMWDHRLGILVFIGLFGTFFHVNGTIKKQVALKEHRLNRIALAIFMFLFANIFFIYFAFSTHELYKCLLLNKPNFVKMDLWTVFWCVGITDFVVRFVTIGLKCVIIIMPRRLVHFRKRGKYFLMLENLSQFYRMLLPIPQWYFYFTDYDLGGQYFAILSTALYLLLKARMLLLKGKDIIAVIKCFWKDTRYGRAPSKEVLTELGDSCPICQEAMSEPIELNMCKHIFCEDCIVMWFDRERTCPMCRAKVAEDPLWRDGSTQSFIQLF